LRVKVDRTKAAFAVSVASGFGAAEGQVDFCSYRRSVDVSDSGLEVADGGESFVHIFGVERRRQSVLDIVGDIDRVFKAVAWDDGNDRPEDLFLRDTHCGMNLGKDGRFKKPSVLINT